MSPISWQGMLVILIVALLLFGSRLPEVARSMGRAVNEFKRGLKEVTDDADPTQQLKSPPDEPEQSAPRREDEQDASPR